MQHVASLSLKEDYIRLFHMLRHIEYTIRKRGGNRWVAGIMEGRSGGLIMEGQEGQKMAERKELNW